MSNVKCMHCRRDHLTPAEDMLREDIASAFRQVMYPDGSVVVQGGFFVSCGQDFFIDWIDMPTTYVDWDGREIQDG